MSKDNVTTVGSLTIEDYDRLKIQAIKVRTQVNQHYESAKDLRLQYDEIVEKIKKNKITTLIQNTSIDVMKELIDNISQKHIEMVVDLLSYALQTVFHDRDYSIEVALGDKRNAKTAELFLVERTKDTVLRSALADAVGGGILAVVGFVLQVFYLGYLKQSPILFVDEGFSQVSTEYIPNLIQLIKQLSEKKDFIFVLISHDDRLIQYADRTYKVDKGVYSLIQGGGN